MDRDEASLVLNSVLLDLPAGSQIDLRAYNLQSGYGDLPLATQHFRLRVALDTATPQKTMHEVIFGDHRETPTKRIWLPIRNANCSLYLEDAPTTSLLP